MPATEGASWIAAGEDALRRYAWAEARESFRRALAIEETPETLELLTRACRWLHDDAGTIGAAERAFALYQRQGAPHAAARIAIWLVVDVLELRGEDAVANGWLGRAHRILDELPPATEHAWLAGIEAYLALLGRNDAPAAIALADRALGIGKQFGATDVTMTALAVKGLALVTQGEVAAGMSLLDEACTATLDEEIEDPNARSTILCALMDACDRVRDFDRASQWCARIRDAAGRWELPALVTVCRPHYAVVLTWRGLWDEADLELRTAIEEYGRIRPLMATEGIVRLAELRLRQGKLDEATELFAQAEHDGISQVGRAELALARGAANDAYDLAQRFLRRIPASDRIERARGLEVLVRAAVSCGNIEAAQDAAAELRESARAIGTDPLRGAALYADAVVAAAQQDTDLARRLFEDAADTFAAAGAPFELGRARLGLGTVLLEQGATLAAARELEAAAATFLEVGAALEAARARSLLHDAPAAGAHAAAAPAGLSTRELEILRLVAAGLSNFEIAERLVLSPRTVERHISNIYGKLGLNGSAARALATAEAFRLGLVVLDQPGTPRT